MALRRERRFAPAGPDRRAPLLEAAALLAVAVVVTAASWAWRSDGLPLRADRAFYERDLSAPVVTAAEARRLYDEGMHMFVDVRPTAATTVPGSFVVREETFNDDLLAVFDFLTPADPLVICGGPELSAASNIAGRLQERGWKDVAILAGGMPAWEAAGGPVTPREDAP